MPRETPNQYNKRNIDAQRDKNHRQSCIAGEIQECPGIEYRVAEQADSIVNDMKIRVGNENPAPQKYLNAQQQNQDITHADEPGTQR